MSARPEPAGRRRCGLAAGWLLPVHVTGGEPPAAAVVTVSCQSPPMPPEEAGIPPFGWCMSHGIRQIMLVPGRAQGSGPGAALSRQAESPGVR